MTTHIVNDQETLSSLKQRTMTLLKEQQRVSQNLATLAAPVMRRILLGLFLLAMNLLVKNARSRTENGG